MSSAEAKEMLRSLVRAARRQGPAADPEALASTCLSLVDDLPGPKRVTCYASFGTEPGTGPLLDALAASGYEVLLPRVVDDDLEWVPASGDTVVSDMGITEPTGAAAPLLPLRAMLVPALAVGVDGARLGKGGGYYDRVIAGLPAEQRPMVIAVVRDEDVMPVATVPLDAHDCPVDAILTPTRVIPCPSP